MSTSIFAQGPRGQRGQQRGPKGPNLEMLEKALDLSEDQVAALKPVFEDTRSEMEALRDQEFDAPEDRRAAAKSIMESQKEKINAILSEAQLQKLETLKEKRGERGPRGPRGDEAKNEKGKELRQALKAYHEENVQPVMLAQRAKLEAQLSSEDKATIEALRAKKEGMKAKMKESKGKGQRPEKPSETQRAEHKADRETIKALLTKYETDIESLLAEIKPQAEEWKEETKAIVDQYRPERTEKAGEKAGEKNRKMRAQKGERGKKGVKKAGPQILHKVRFLMLDPNASPDERTLEESPFQLQAYPNPAAGLTTINYTVEKDGQVQITLNDKMGTMNRVLLNSFQKAGTYTLEINTSDLQGGNYYYTINDAGGSKPVTKQLIIKR
ncbi:MAG: hypothetical protein Sapg2KO_51670 [Saprospiraceae bacterium]